MRRGIVLLVAMVAMLLPELAHANLNKDQRRAAMKRTVRIFAWDQDARGQKSVLVSGSGTILTADGAVLTNRHVLVNPHTRKPFQYFSIALTVDFARAPEEACKGIPSHSEFRDHLDLALIKCEYDMEGKPWKKPNDWPVAKVGSSEDLVPGDDVIVIGYPGVGGDSVTYTTGKISGFMGENQDSGRFWIKTDAEIASGNSGGTALDEDGKLIGVPTAVQTGEGEVGGRLGLIRPIEWARDLINLANGGWEPGTPVAEPGKSGSGKNKNGGKAGNPKKGDKPDANAGGVFVVSQVKATDNNTPVANATVAILKPGVRWEDFNEKTAKDTVLTLATTDNQGRFVTKDPLPRGQKFTVIVVADGFVPLMQNNVLDTTGNIPERYDPWGVITLKRK